MRLALLLTLLPVSAPAADFAFCWRGAGGHVLEGRMTIRDAALARPLVTEDDVTAFAIAGYLDGRPVGSWNLEDLTPRTAWNLNFDPAAMAFVTGGYSRSPRGQAWNASGSVDDCGLPGFGFNSGASGQDVCIDNTWRTDSIVVADTPFPVHPAGSAPPCLAAPVIGTAPQPHPLPRS